MTSGPEPGFSSSNPVLFTCITHTAGKWKKVSFNLESMVHLSTTRNGLQSRHAVSEQKQSYAGTT